MRLEVAGAQITDAVVETLENLQNDPVMTQHYIDTIDRTTRKVIDNFSGDDNHDSAAISDLKVLQMIRRDILSLAMPPDVDNPANDTPTASY